MGSKISARFVKYSRRVFPLCDANDSSDQSRPKMIFLFYGANFAVCPHICEINDNPFHNIKAIFEIHLKIYQFEELFIAKIRQIPVGRHLCERLYIYLSTSTASVSHFRWQPISGEDLWKYGTVCDWLSPKVGHGRPRARLLDILKFFEHAYYHLLV